MEIHDKIANLNSALNEALQLAQEINKYFYDLPFEVLREGEVGKAADTITQIYVGLEDLEGMTLDADKDGKYF